MTTKYKRMTARTLCKVLGLSERDYFEHYYTWQANNRGVCSLKSQIASTVTIKELKNKGLIN